MSNIKVHFDITHKLKVKIYFWFFKFNIKDKIDTIDQPNIDKSTDEYKYKKKSLKKSNNNWQFLNILEMVIDFIKSLKKPILFFIKKISINKFKIYAIIAKGNAFDTAVSYGNFCMLFYGLISIIYNFFKLDIESINISPDFDEDKKDIYSISFYISIKIYTILFLISGIVINFLFNTLKRRVTRSNK